MEDHILLKYIQNKLDNPQRLAVEEWMQENEENEKTVLNLARIYYAKTRTERIQSRDALAAYHTVESRIKKRNLYTWVHRSSVTAASITALLALCFTIWTIAKKTEHSYFYEATIHTNHSMRTDFKLPDSSYIHLNSNSALNYSIPAHKNGERKIVLRGEAWFNVAYNPDQPFIVSTDNGLMQVTVHGTSFNIQAYPDDYISSVTLLEGSVSLSTKKKDGRYEVHFLSPGQKALFDPVSGTVEIGNADIERDISWTQGRLIFKNTPMKEVLRDLELFYNVKIQVKNKEIETYRFTGIFNNKQLFQVLDYLRISSNIHYEINQMSENIGNEKTSTHVTLWLKK